MRRINKAIIIVLTGVTLSGLNQSAAICQTNDGDLLTLSKSGWTVNVSPAEEVIEISHDSLNVILREIKLNLNKNKVICPLKKWSAVLKGENQLNINTAEPASSWLLELNQDNLIISATSSDLVLTALAPASPERIVARLMDNRGVPVNWKGTDEIVVSWNGKETCNMSYLPAKNPEVITFGLGRVSASNLHCLFDRKTDIAIEFPDATIMERNTDDPDQLDITIPVPGNVLIKLIPDYYPKITGLPFYTRFDNSVFKTAPVIWGSWTAYYFEACESDIVRNTDWLAANLKPYGFQYVQLDDGYDRGKSEGHYWIENWNVNLFPHGPEWLAGYIKSKGLKPGLWLVPNSYAGAFKKHPEWYIYDKSGNVINDYKTPALDYTNPGVQEWLRKLFGTLKKWGFEYYKFDGECSLPMYVPDLDSSRLYDKSEDFLVSYRKRLKLIRDVIGPETFIEGCVAGTPLNGLGYFNSCFNGADMYNSWKGSYPVFSSINANAFLNNMVMYVMPGEGIDVSPLMTVEEAKQKMTPRTIQVALSREDPFTGFGTTIAEARTLVSFVSMTGVAYPLTSIMPELPEERVRLLKMTMPTMPIIPVDLFSRGTDITWDKFKHTNPEIYIHNYPEIIDLKVSSVSGTYDVVGLINWRNDTVLRELPFSGKLGLKTGIKHVVFDFWNQKFLGVFKDTIEVAIGQHDTRVLLVHELLDRPQLAGISRHISGAYSILDLQWDISASVLKGSSETIDGEIYSVFIYVPDGMSVIKAEAKAGHNSKLKVSYELDGNSLKVNFQGQPDPVSWEVGFSGKPEKN
jgi:hypothetical protein